MIKKNYNWLIWVLAVIAVIAIVLAAIALHRVNVTGQGIFDIFKRGNVQETQPQQQTPITTESKGLLGDFYISNGGNFENLKGYEVKYDADGNLIYEIIDEGTKFNLGEGYEVRETANGGMVVYNLVGGTAVGTEKVCGCNFPPGSTGSCINKCSKFENGCTGKCTGDTCTATGCKLKDRIIYPD